MRPTTEMNKGVQILLERMESHPEEFTPMYSINHGHEEFPPKWSGILNSVGHRIQGSDSKALGYLKDDEIKALWDKLQKLLGDNFTHSVMRSLLDDTTDVGEYDYKWVYEDDPIVKNKGKPVTKAELSSFSKLTKSETTKKLRVRSV
jgi:hypothetical protein